MSKLLARSLVRRLPCTTEPGLCGVCANGGDISPLDGSCGVPAATCERISDGECEGLHRQPCGSTPTPNACGDCLDGYRHPLLAPVNDTSVACVVRCEYMPDLACEYVFHRLPCSDQDQATAKPHHCGACLDESWEPSFDGDSDGSLVECRTNCSLARESTCQTLKRGNCTTTPNVCGDALPGYYLPNPASDFFTNQAAQFDCRVTACESLNRQPCSEDVSEVANTCGPCLDGYGTDKLTRADPGNTLCTAVTDTQNIYVLALVAALLGLGLLASFVAKAKSPDGARWTIPLEVAFSVADLLTDLQFAFFAMGKEELNPIFGVAAFGSIGVSLVAGVVCIFYNQAGLMESHEFVDWLHDHKGVYSFATLVAVLNPESFVLVASLLFGKDAFSAQLPEANRVRLLNTGAVPRLLEDLPQLFVQLGSALALGSVGLVTGVSLVISLLAVANALLSRCVARSARKHIRRRKQMGINSTAESGVELTEGSAMARDTQVGSAAPRP